MKKYELDVVVTRGAEVESRHRVHAAIVGPGDRVLGHAGDAETVTFWRSCAKPFQVMPFLRAGGLDELGWGDEELALACASHGGEPEHVEIAAAMLRDLGLEEGDLACGPHEPLSGRGARKVRETIGFPTRLHNNCSGKHAAMLAAAQQCHEPTTGYQLAPHPVQRRALATVAEWSGVPESSVGIAIDGCGVTVFALPLVAMARAYSRLAAASHDDEIPRRIVSAMTTHPFLVGGTDRFDTVLMEETDGRVLAKVGAEGVHSVAILDDGIGVAVKVEDGAQRAQFPAVLRVLQHLGALPEELPARLSPFLAKPVLNTRGERVGEIEPAA